MFYLAVKCCSPAQLLLSITEVFWSVLEDFNLIDEISMWARIASEEKQTWQFSFSCVCDFAQHVMCVSAGLLLVSLYWACECVHACFYEHDWMCSTAGWTDVFHQPLCCKHVMAFSRADDTMHLGHVFCFLSICLIPLPHFPDHISGRCYCSSYLLLLKTTNLSSRPRITI